MSVAPDPLWSASRSAAPVHDIGRQLHDIVVPQLFVLTTGLAALQRRPDRDDQLVDDLVETAAQALADLRAISRGQSLALGGPLGHVADRLIAATEPIATLSGCRVTVEVDDPEVVIEPDLDHDIRAVVWEALANAIRHGRARCIDVAIASFAGRLRIVVVDDGEWTSSDPHGTGLRGLERRATTRGGSFAVLPGRAGTVLAWEVPLVTSAGLDGAR